MTTLDVSTKILGDGSTIYLSRIRHLIHFAQGVVAQSQRESSLSKKNIKPPVNFSYYLTASAMRATVHSYHADVSKSPLKKKKEDTICVSGILNSPSKRGGFPLFSETGGVFLIFPRLPFISYSFSQSYDQRDCTSGAE